MIIQVNANRNVESSQRLHDYLNERVSEALDRFSDNITRVEIHLSDQNSDKKGGADDQQCRIETRLSGLQPVIVTSREENMERAIESALDKTKASLTSILGKLKKK